MAGDQDMDQLMVCTLPRFNIQCTLPRRTGRSSSKNVVKKVARQDIIFLLLFAYLCFRLREVKDPSRDHSTREPHKLVNQSHISNTSFTA